MLTGPALWRSDDLAAWRDALARYDDVIAAQGIDRLPALDRWYQHDFPAAMAARAPRYCTLDELVRVTEWKMTRGVWRAKNHQLVKGNDAERVALTTADALALAPHPTAPIKTIAALEGVGPATASAVVSAALPDSYPFFDEIVAACVPSLGAVAWTLGYYGKYAAALRERASSLGAPWSPVMVEQALWASQGGKARWKT